MAGLDVIALTDHDLPPVLPAGVRHHNGRQIRLLHGVEISTAYADKELHLLVYFPNEMPSHFVEFCTGLVKARAKRYDEAIDNIGLDGLHKAGSEAYRGEVSLTRTHLARALVAAGHVPTVQSAFDQWLGRHTKLVPRVTISFQEAVVMAKEAGGFTSWAHPDLEDTKKWLAGFADMGLDAIEVFRPSMGRMARDRLISLAHKHGVFMTGGSDYHGGSNRPLGSFSMSGRHVRPWAQRIDIEL